MECMQTMVSTGTAQKSIAVRQLIIKRSCADGRIDNYNGIATVERVCGPWNDRRTCKNMIQEANSEIRR